MGELANGARALMKTDRIIAPGAVCGDQTDRGLPRLTRNVHDSL